MNTLQHKIWRWHFYAGILTLPFVVLLSITGTIYVFKPQIEAFTKHRLSATLPTVNPGEPSLSADQLVSIGQQALPEMQLKRYLVPEPKDAIVQIEFRKGREGHTLWLNRANGDIVESYQSSSSLLNTVKKLHSELLLGNRGSYLVELVASWMIVLLVSGVYLWWPRPSAGKSWLTTIRPALLPNLRTNKYQNKRQKWRELHGSVGIWFSLLILAFLLTGLPWTQLWGAGFDRVEKAMKWGGPGQEWRVTLRSASKPTSEPKSDGLDLWETSEGTSQVKLQSGPQPQGAGHSLQQILDNPQLPTLVPPIQVQPPRGDNGVWTVRAMSAYRPERLTLHYDKWSGEEIMRIGFKDYHPVKQVVSLGISLHEGALFGWLNQILAAVVALTVVFLSVSGAIMWWQRRPKGKLAAPKKRPNIAYGSGIVVITLALAAFLPMVAISLVLIGLIELLRYACLTNIERA
jgi:uncharacterized iron-regulated membrane protein